MHSVRAGNPEIGVIRCDFVADNVAHLSLLTALFSAVPPLLGDGCY
jgi:hypothetical protein